MLAHYHGQVLNASELGRALGTSDATARRHLDLLAATFVVRLLMPRIARRMAEQQVLIVASGSGARPSSASSRFTW